MVLDCGFGFTVNSGAAESMGFEVETSVAVTDSLVVNASVGYADAEITESGMLQTTISTPGSKLQHVPEWTFSTSASYDFSFTDTIAGLFRVDYSYIGDSISYMNRVPGEGSPPTTRDEINLLNMRISAFLESWEVSFYAKNMLDELTTWGDNRSLAVETNGRPRLSQNRPRTIGVEARFNF